MKVICTLKNNPSPHIHAKATEFPHRTAFNQRKFIKSAKESRFSRMGKLDSFRPCPQRPAYRLRNPPKIRLETPDLMERLRSPGANYH
jgi:hypothetical protein